MKVDVSSARAILGLALEISALDSLYTEAKLLLVVNSDD